MTIPDLRIDGDRLANRLAELARIGATPDGGVTRPAFSAEDHRAHDLFAGWLAEAGLAVRWDAAGNLFGRLPGADPAAAPLLIGSHLDTVPNGGRYDGALGCVGALEVAATIAGSGLTPARPLEVVVWSDEEGWRFSGGFFGSMAFTGTLRPAMLDAVDAQGTSIGEALKKWGLDRATVGDAARHGPLAGYLELHIEQGPMLESRGLAVGVVDSIVGLVGLDVHLEGRAGHAGTVPMALRADALCAAAEAVLACERIGRAAEGVTATVGTLSVRPGASNVIPGACRFSVDLRSADATTLWRCQEAIREAIEAAAQRRSARATIAPSMQVAPVALSERLVAALERACARRGLQAPRMGSGAGHDAMILAGIAEAGMLFVRCREGISHHPSEYAGPEDNTTGVQVLLDAALELCGTAS